MKVKRGVRFVVSNQIVLTIITLYVYRRTSVWNQIITQAKQIIFKTCNKQYIILSNEHIRIFFKTNHTINNVSYFNNKNKIYYNYQRRVGGWRDGVHVVWPPLTADFKMKQQNGRHKEYLK